MQISPNDFDQIPDWLKVAFTAGATIVTVLWSVIKLLKHPIEKDLNGVGERVRKLEEFDVEVETRLAQQDRAMFKLQADIMSAIAASGGAQLDAVHKLGLQVTRVEERLNVKDELVRAVNHLADRLRGNNHNDKV